MLSTLAHCSSPPGGPALMTDTSSSSSSLKRKSSVVDEKQPLAKKSKSSCKPKYKYSRYAVNGGEHTIKSRLEQYGVAIVPGILDEKECSAMHSQIWDHFEHISQTWAKPITRGDPTTWRGFYDLFPLHSFLHQHFNIGHCQASWNIRANPKVAQPFADLHKIQSLEDLLVSFDGLSFGPPPEVTSKGWNRNNTWYHTDQSYQRSGFECAQGWVTALDVEEGDATLSIMEGSHNYHKECSEEFKDLKASKGDWCKLTREQEVWYRKTKGCKYVNIKCPKGSLVLWDSRTIHCGIEASRGRANPKFRSIVYVCYLPRMMATKKDLEKKRKAFLELRTTSHWANKAKMFAKQPQHYGKGLPAITPIPLPTLTPLAKQFAGF